MSYRKDKKITKLQDLEVHEVSIVDRPANQRRFLTVKNAADQAGEEIDSDEQGNLVTKPKAVEKNILALSEELKMEAYNTLPRICRRLDTLYTVIEYANWAEEGPGGLAKLVGKEMQDLAKGMDELGKKFGSVEKSDSVPEDLEKHFAELASEIKKDNSEINETKLQGLVEILEQKVQKEGQEQMSNKEENTLEAIHGLLANLTQTLQGDADKCVIKSEETETEDNSEENFNDAIKEFKNTVETMKSQLEEKDARIAELEKAAPLSNGVVAEQVEKEDTDDELWPYDMNESSEKF